MTLDARIADDGERLNTTRDVTPAAYQHISIHPSGDRERVLLSVDCGGVNVMLALTPDEARAVGAQLSYLADTLTPADAFDDESTVAVGGV